MTTDQTNEGPQIATPESIQIEKTKKSIINAGQSIHAIGWLMGVVNCGVAVYFLYKNLFGNQMVQMANFSSLVIFITVSLLFIIIGNRIKKGFDAHIVVHLGVLLALFGVVLILVILRRAFLGVFVYLALGYVISAFFKARKAMQIPAFSESFTQHKYILTPKKWIIFAVVCVAVFVAALTYDRQIAANVDKRLQQAFNDSAVPLETLVRQFVEGAKVGVRFPYQIDRLTKLTNVTAAGKTVQFHYTLSGVDQSVATPEKIKALLLPNACNENQTKIMLARGVSYEYMYAFDNSDKKINIAISQADCVSATSTRQEVHLNP